MEAHRRPLAGPSVDFVRLPVAATVGASCILSREPPGRFRVRPAHGRGDEWSLGRTFRGGRAPLDLLPSFDDSEEGAGQVQDASRPPEPELVLGVHPVQIREGYRRVLRLSAERPLNPHRPEGRLPPRGDESRPLEVPGVRVAWALLRLHGPAIRLVGRVLGFYDLHEGPSEAPAFPAPA